jgi:hypothetical protein
VRALETLPNGALARLAFWAKNMTLIHNAGMDWPGFSYTEPEWSRMATLADAVSDVAYNKFKILNAIAFIALAALGIAGGFMPLALLLFPNPAQTPAFEFILLLAAVSLLIIGIGLPISMRIAAAMSTDAAMRARLESATGDATLARKVSFQINRIVAIMCGLLVPGTLLFIAFNVKAGPIITVLKWLAIAAMTVSVAYSAKAKPK